MWLQDLFAILTILYYAILTMLYYTIDLFPILVAGFVVVLAKSNKTKPLHVIYRPTPSRLIATMQAHTS